MYYLIIKLKMDDIFMNFDLSSNDGTENIIKKINETDTIDGLNKWYDFFRDYKLRFLKGLTLAYWTSNIERKKAIESNLEKVIKYIEERRKNDGRN